MEVKHFQSERQAHKVEKYEIEWERELGAKNGLWLLSIIVIMKKERYWIDGMMS
jgi:hypothetical protein